MWKGPWANVFNIVHELSSVDSGEQLGMNPAFFSVSEGARDLNTVSEDLCNCCLSAWNHLGRVSVWSGEPLGSVLIQPAGAHHFLSRSLTGVSGELLWAYREAAEHQGLHFSASECGDNALHFCCPDCLGIVSSDKPFLSQAALYWGILSQQQRWTSTGQS